MDPTLSFLFSPVFLDSPHGERKSCAPPMLILRHSVVGFPISYHSQDQLLNRDCPRSEKLLEENSGAFVLASHMWGVESVALTRG